MASLFRLVPSFVVIGGFCLILGLGYALWNFEQPPFPLELLQQLDSGMNAGDVQEVLGTPDDVWLRNDADGQGYQEWAYQRKGSWPIVYIYFTPDGRFSSSRYDP